MYVIVSSLLIIFVVLFGALLVCIENYQKRRRKYENKHNSTKISTKRHHK